MSRRPSEPLLALLRKVAQEKGLNTAALATAAGLPRARVKHVLGGAEALTVDEFMLISQALELGPEAFGLPASQAEARADALEEAALKADQGVPEIATRRRLGDPFGNHAEQALTLGFDLGCDLFIVLDSRQLNSSGVPDSVLDKFPQALPIRLDAAFHRHHDPAFLPRGLRIVLSFDALYTCTLPWAAFLEVRFMPLPPSPPDAPDDQEQDDDGTEPSAPGSHLKLVT